MASDGEAAAGPAGEAEDGRRSKRTLQAAVVVAGLAAVALAIALSTTWSDFVVAQRVTGPGFGAVLTERSTVEAGLLVDVVFIAAYAVLGCAAFSLIPDRQRRSRTHPAAVAGIILLLGGVAADLAENAFLAWALAEGRGSRTSTLLGIMRAAGLVKWGLLGTAVLTLAALVAVRAWRRPSVPGLPGDRPPGATDWDPPPAGTDAKVGVCLSGGGVRSAAFSLGALQALRDRGVLARARYLTAASGGGYLAAGWAVSHAGPPDDDGSSSPRRWEQGSPEERWFRDRSSYLVPSLSGGLVGVARLVAGVAINLLLIWLVLFTIARPLGWVVNVIHSDMWDDDVGVVRDGVGTLALAPGSPRAVATSTGTGGAAVTRYEVRLVPAPGNEVCVDVAPYDRKDTDACYAVEPVRTGLVDVRGGRGTVVRQPTARVGALVGRCDRGCDQGESLAVTAGPRLRLTTPVLADEAELPTALTVVRQPRVESTTGLAAVGYPRFEWWMWELSGGLLLVAAAAALAATTARLHPRREAVLRSLAGALVGAGLVALAVTVVLPWSSVWVPRTLSSAFEALPGGQDVDEVTGTGVERYLLPAAGFLATALAATRQFLSSGRKGAGTGPSRPWYARIWERLARRRAQLKWYETSPSKILLAVVLPLTAVVLFVFQLRDAAAQGWAGRQIGWSSVRDYLPYELWPADWLKVVAVAALLGALAVTVDAHAWSLYPFYKRRLSSAFLVRRKPDDGRADAVDYDRPLPFTPTAAAPGWAGLPLPGPDRGPQLVLCCAVNLSQYGAVPPGRRAASFTFSSTEIGGPLVGYRASRDFFESLPESRRRDLTVPSAMAISGAAFSPAMGKFNLGPVGSVLAVGNLRLGVWLPNPCRLDDGAPKENGRPRSGWWRLRRPGWTWFVRELLNAYLLERRYVYVSDGGHWDNLGLVELFRRGCTEIYCVSCAGDGPDSFNTIAEAMALAREELGVEVDLDPSPLRSAASPAAGAGGRELRREGSRSTASSFAGRRAVPGSFTYTRCSPRVKGRIWYVEADLTANMPFDVHAFAEAEPVFPDDSTGDQVFNHRQFESYRRLGYHQAEAMG